MTEAATTMTRAELYERVWATPMRELAPELGVTRVALARLCRKHAVPTPPPGYWSQVALGQAPARATLPEVVGSDDVEMPGRERTVHVLRGNRVTRDPSFNRPSDSFPPAGAVQLRTNLGRCDPMIRATADYFERVAREVKAVEANRRKPARARELQLNLMSPRSLNGRFNPNAEGCLNVLASLEHVKWIMLFHDALFRELKSLRAKVQPHKGYRRHAAQVVYAGEGQAISFKEGTSKFKGAIGQRSLVSVLINPFMATDDYSLTLERRFGKRVWRAPRAKLESQIGFIAREIIDLIAQDAAAAARGAIEMAKVHERLAREEEERRRLAAERARQAFREAARCAQGGRALSVGRQQLEYEATLRVLADLEARISTGDEGAGLRAWLSVARDGLTPPVDALLADLQREIAVDGGPDWWPEQAI